MARAKAKEAAAPAPPPGVYDVLTLLDATNTIADVSKSFKLAGATVDMDARRSTAISSGLLATDLLIGGGIYPGGMYTFFGPEQSAKSTHMMTALASLFYSDVPIIIYADAEGSTTPDYIEAIARASNVNRGIDIQKTFGIRDPKTGKWVIEPRINYTPENSLEAIWKSFAQILRRLPDKVYIDGEWWLLFDNTKENISRFKGQGDTALGKEYGKIAIKSLDGGRAQALFIVDSYPAMISEADDDEDGTNALGLEARGHSKHLKKVKGRLKRKHCTLIGTNQLRDRPMAKAWEPKDYEPGGNALKFYSDCRVSQRPRSVPHAQGAIELEPSVLERNGDDTYRYICMRAIKNKFGAPYLEAWYRIWVSDPRGQGHGFCPVYDTFNYLKNTGQATGAVGGKKGLNINFGKLQLKKLSWLDFKGLILFEGKDLKAHCEKLGIESNPKIRERCFNQIASGAGQEMFYETLHGLNVVDQPEYEDMTDEALMAEAIDRKLDTKRALRKYGREELIDGLMKLDDDEAGDDDADDDTTVNIHDED